MMRSKLKFIIGHFSYPSILSIKTSWPFGNLSLNLQTSKEM